MKHLKILKFELGRIPAGDTVHYTDCTVGLEVAGRRADTGERVMGFIASRGFATTVNANEDWMTTIPDNWSMSDAVSVLSTYSTLWYGLIEKAGLKKGILLWIIFSF